METRKNTIAGVLVWTPAPACTSPTSSVIYDDVCDDENGEQDKKDDFVSQMDENGIIGLSGALKNVGLEETCSDEESDCNPGCYPTLLTPEKLWDTRRAPEEMSYSLRDHLSGTKLPGDNMMGSIEEQSVNEAIKREKDQRTEYLAERGEYLDPSIKLKHGDRNDHSCTSGKLGATNALTKSYMNKVENKKIRSLHSCVCHTPAGVSSQHCPVSQSARAVSALTFPHLLHFTPEELAAAPGIDAETFPEMDSIESLPDSHSSVRSSPRCPRNSESNEQMGHQTTECPKQLLSHTSLKSRQSPDRDSGTHTVNTNTKAAKVNKSKKWALSHRTPDFSKVEPRVHFPKSGYKPPKSRISSEKEFPGSPIVYKSPAEMIKDVLLEVSDQLPSTSACDKPPASALSSTVPQDFRSWKQATTLLEQLQEDYNRLLTKYAEAENTIDRLRLEAKSSTAVILKAHCPAHFPTRPVLPAADYLDQVNLYSDLPNPSHTVPSGLSHDASKLMTLDFPQAQKADIKPAFHSNGHSSPQIKQAEQLERILYIQADSFLHQMQAYQDILRRENLKPPEQMRILSQLAEGLDSLERGYLLAKDDHKCLQQQGTKVSHFDPERKLEGLIYQCGLHMEDLKEQVEKMLKGQPTCEALLSPSDYNQPHVPSVRGTTLTCPQTPSVPLLVDHGGAAEVSSVSEESDPTEGEDDEMFKSFYLKPVTGKHRCAAKHPASVMDGNTRSNHQDNLPLHTSKQQTSTFFPSSHNSTTLPVHLSSSSKSLAVGKSHSTSLSSLGDNTTSERKNSTHQTGSSKLLSQDGIVSPEAESGFVGSESSHLTPLAAWSPLHQRAPESHVEPSESSHLPPDQQMRSRQGQRRHTFSCSPQHWVLQKEQHKINCRTSGFGLESDSTNSASEDGQSDQFNRSITSIHSSHSSSHPSMQYHHGNSLRAPGFTQVVNRNDAIQSLQAEVTTLKESLERCLRNKKPRPCSSVRAAPPAPCSTFAPDIRSGDEQQNDIRRERGQTRSENEVEDLRQGTKRSASEKPGMLTVSELKSSTMSPQPQMSRCTQTSAIETDNYLHTNGDYHRTPRTDRKRDGPYSPHCHHCAVCGRPNTYRSSKQECCRGPDSTMRRTCQPAAKTGKSTFMAAPLALLQYMPVPPPVLLYSPPIYTAPSNSAGISSAVGGHGGMTAEVKERNRCSLSADKQLLGRSLNRAIRAAQHMKNTSGHMAHSLATGLDYHELLTQSCSY